MAIAPSRHRPGPDSQVQVLYAATDFTAENGATLGWRTVVSRLPTWRN